MKHHVGIMFFATAAKLVLCAWLLLMTWHVPATAASPSTELKRVFRNLDRQLCRSFATKKCSHRNAARKTKASNKNKRVVAKPAPITSRAAPAVRNMPDKMPEKPKPVAPLVAVAIPTPVPAPASVQPMPTENPPVPVLKPQILEVSGKPLPIPPPLPALVPVPVPLPALVPVPVPAIHPMLDNTLKGEACTAELSRIGVKFEAMSTPVASGACTVFEAVKLSSVAIGDDSLTFPDHPTLTCGFAVRFAHWVIEQGEPIVESGLHGKIKAMGTGPGYQCRGRNGDSGSKLSEHAFGNAVDIERITLVDGQKLEVANATDSSSSHQPVLAALRAAACQYFMTVLGPGTNSAHASHFHFDLERRGKNGDHKLCQ